MKIRIDFSAILASIIVLYCNGGMLGFFKGSSLVTVLIYGALALWFALVLIRERAFMTKYVSICFAVLTFFVFLNLFMFILNPSTMGAMSRMRKNIMFLLMFVAIFIYYSAPKRQVGRKMILYTWIIDTVLTSIYTIYRLIEMPTLSRILATENPESHLESGSSLAGIFGFGSIYGLLFVVTAITGLIPKVKPVYKIVMICCAVLFVYTVIQAQFFIASVLCAIGIIMGMLLSGKTTLRKTIIYLTFLPVGVLILYIAVKEILPSLAYSNALPQFISDRLILFLNGISMEELLGTSRGVVYLKSFSAIAQSYGIGIMFMKNTSTGGHSEILDLIAIYGAPLAALLIYGIWQIKKFISRFVPEELTYNYNIVWILFLLMGIFNTALWCQTTVSVFLIIPLAYMEFYSKKTTGSYIEE